MRNGRRVLAVDLDGTMAKYDHWRGVEHVGEPIKDVVDRVKEALRIGIEVWVYTARVAPDMDGTFRADRDLAISTIEDWCLKHIGRALPVTSTKFREFDEFWDDKTVSVVSNQAIGMPPMERSLWYRLWTAPRLMRFDPPPGQRLIVDDPHAPTEAQTVEQRKALLKWYTEEWSKKERK
jgi:hypothetical protein